MKKNILFVSDDSRLLRTWKRWFNNDFDVMVKSGAYDALELLNTAKVDLVVSELMMDEMSGDDFLQFVAVQFPATNRVLTSEACEESRVKDLFATGIIHQHCKRAWDKDMMMSVIYGLSRVMPSHITEQEKQNNKKVDSFELGDDLKGQLPAVMLLDKDQTHKNSIRLLCKGLKLRTYSISNFSYAKETTELRPEIGLVIITVEGTTNTILQVIERIKMRKKPVVIICLLDDYTFGHSAMNFINNGNIFRCYTKPLPLADIANMIKDGLRQSIKLQRIEALMPDNEGVKKEENDGRLQKLKNIFRKTA